MDCFLENRLSSLKGNGGDGLCMEAHNQNGLIDLLIYRFSAQIEFAKSIHFNENLNCPATADRHTF